MLIIAAPEHNENIFISLIHESNCDFTVQSLAQWHSNHQQTPKGFVYLRVAPEITLKHTLKKKISTSLAEIQKQHEYDEHYFVQKVTMPAELHTVPLLILNGTINFEDDFSQFYTHLFSIKKFFREIKDAHDKAQGTYVYAKKKA